MTLFAPCRASQVPISDTPRDAPKNVSAPFHTGDMAKESAPISIHPHEQTADVEFHVTYLDPHSGHIRREEFPDLASAERFASAQLHDSDCWAVVDQVAIQHAARMVA